jgi:hypothetical protein
MLMLGANYHSQAALETGRRQPNWRLSAVHRRPRATTKVLERRNAADAGTGSDVERYIGMSLGWMQPPPTTR